MVAMRTVPDPIDLALATHATGCPMRTVAVVLPHRGRRGHACSACLRLLPVTEEIRVKREVCSQGSPAWPIDPYGPALPRATCGNHRVTRRLTRGRTALLSHLIPCARSPQPLANFSGS